MSELDQELRARLASLARSERCELDETTRKRQRRAALERAERPRALGAWLAVAAVACGAALLLARGTVAPWHMPVASELAVDAPRRSHVASAPPARCAALEPAEFVRDAHGLRRLALTRALVVAEGNAAVRVAALTSCLLELELAHGQLAIHARDLAGGQLVVRTPHGAVHVRGTVFGVAADGALEVQLVEGAVEVTWGEGATTLRAGESLRLDGRPRRHALSDLARSRVLGWLGLGMPRPEHHAPAPPAPLAHDKVWHEGAPLTPPGPEPGGSLQPDGRPMYKPHVELGDPP